MDYSTLPPTDQLPTTSSSSSFDQPWSPLFTMLSPTQVPDNFRDTDYNVGMDNGSEDPCEVPYMADRRWYLVAVAGTSLSIISLICNILIARILLRPKHSHFFFLGLLALSDCFLSFCYGPVIAMDIIKNRFQILWLSRLWWSIVGPLLAMCHVSMTFSCLCIILGTIERYLITVKHPILSCFRSNRGRLALLMFVVALLLRGTAVFEVTIVKNGNCTGLTEYEPSLTPLVQTWIYGTVFRFYIRNIATVFIPFFLLAYLNFRIVESLRRQKRSAAMFRFGGPEGTSEHKMRIRSATRLLLLIVFSYLLANFLNVFITAWEYVDLESTQTEITFDIYETLTDIISMLYVLSCATRLPIYITCNQEIRTAFYEFICKSCNKGKFDHEKHEYKPIKSPGKQIGLPTIGTDFDRVVVAMALATRASKSPGPYIACNGKAPCESEDEETDLKVTKANGDGRMCRIMVNGMSSNGQSLTEGGQKITIIENPLAMNGN
ncbi:7 transmembrane receptor (rhodopsin family) domain-containing protein [Ditylenchus destructor]|uniref:7 transmembrane receptor (Rhodopsin family) domain-containing protein n=1 Tax=Ditylenchus destructor TaxID=166010 RepID=A0AAD4R3L1_9BILA|nr:7 transmembrane receptor (rhodopsin family) domain-containing protein [Ditylenchus destructor]